MTGDELRQWRENHKLSQAELGDHLNWTRDMVANRENGRAPCPEGLEGILTLVGALVASEAAKTQPKALNQARTRGHPAQVFLTLDGTRVHPDIIWALPKGRYFWKYDWIDDDNGHHMFNLYKRNNGREINCTPVRLDANTWIVRADFMLDNPAVVGAVKELNERLAPMRANPPQTLEDAILPNDKRFAQAT